MSKKWILSALALATLALTAPHAEAGKTKPKKNPPECKQLFKQEDELCAHFMCDEDIKAGTYKNLSECVHADDYGEAASEGCYGKGFLAKVVKEYNEENGTKIFCNPDLR